MRQKFTEENRWKSLVKLDPLPFNEPNVLRGIDATPPKEVLIKLYDNETYDIVFQQFLSADGAYEIRVYLQFKRNLRILLACTKNMRWVLGESNKYGDFYTFLKQYPIKFTYALKKLRKPDKVEPNVKRNFNIFMQRTVRNYF